jgi:hypothetical protein
LTNSVRHEYDTKLENLKADLKAKASQIDVLRGGVLSGVTIPSKLIAREETASHELSSSFRSPYGARRASEALGKNPKGSGLGSPLRI